MRPGMEEADLILSPHTQEVEARHMTHHTCLGGGQERSEGVPPKATYSKVHWPKLGEGELTQYLHPGQVPTQVLQAAFYLSTTNTA